MSCLLLSWYLRGQLESLALVTAWMMLCLKVGDLDEGCSGARDCGGRRVWQSDAGKACRGVRLLRLCEDHDLVAKIAQYLATAAVTALAEVEQYALTIAEREPHHCTKSPAQIVKIMRTATSKLEYRAWSSWR